MTSVIIAREPRSCGMGHVKQMMYHVSALCRMTRIHSLE